ncbi:MAG: ABC transporter permease [Planctomycetota bacterium]|jgi:oligopeptide transport system permease protein
MAADEHIPGGEPHPSSIPPTPAAPTPVEPATPEPEEAVAGVSLWADARRRLLKNKLAVSGVIIVFLVSLSAIFAPLFSPVGPEVQHFWVGARAPGYTHPDVRNLATFTVGKPLNPTEVPTPLLGATGNHTAVFRLARQEIVEYTAKVSSKGKVTRLYRTQGVHRVPSVAVSGADSYLMQLGSTGQPMTDEAGNVIKLADLSIATKQPVPPVFQRPDRKGRWTLIFQAVSQRLETLTMVMEQGAITGLTLTPPGGEPAPIETTDVRGEDVLSWTLDGDERTLTHPCGTDKQGRDLLARTLYGGRISLMVALLATVVSLLIGVLYGAFSGLQGGRVDNIMMRIVDILYGLPYIFLVIILMVAFGKDLIVLFIALGAVQWLTMARIVRGQVLSLKEKEFVQAARTTGASTWSILTRHLIPNVLGVVAVYTTLTIPAVVLQESFLAFIGLGVQWKGRNLESWGALVKNGMDNLGTTAGENWWLLLVPSIVMSVTLFAFNFLGDGLRDALDPQQKGRT